MTINDYTKKEWDYLIILDACRYDIFKEVVEHKKLKGKLTMLDVRVHCTPEWYHKYWKMKNDINLLTANPHPFHHKIGKGVYENFKTAIFTDKDSPYAPREFKKGKMVEKIYDIWEPNILIKFFQKYKKTGEKYLLHFIPPHLPFMGKKGREFARRMGMEIATGHRLYGYFENFGRQGNWKKIVKYYKENLIYVMDCLYDNLNLFDGKVVISSDHAELLGEPNFDDQGRYGHRILINDEVKMVQRTVPWFEVEV